MDNNLLGNLVWKFAERFSAQIVSTFVSIILARLLLPEHYGIISIVMIFISLANVLVSDGFGSALIQKKDADELDFYSVLYFNLAFSIVLYLLLFIAAPVISEFYGNDYEILTSVLRILGIRIILAAINSVQQAYISKNMMFRINFYSSLCGTLFSAIVGISLAYFQFGVWALVVQYLVSTTVTTIVLMIILRKKPRMLFSIQRLRQLFPYGSRILVTGVLITGYQDLRSLIIGKLYTSADLAFYDKGKQFPGLIVTNINSSIGSVLFPKLSQEQGNAERLKEYTRKSIRFSAYIMCPLMFGLAAVAKPFVELVLTEKWLPCVHIMQLFCVIYMFQPIHSSNMQAIKAIGRSDIYLKVELIKKIIELVLLFCVMRISVNAIAISMAICTTLFTAVNAYPNKKLLNYGIAEQLQDIVPSLVMSFIMFLMIYSVQLWINSSLCAIIMQIVSGIGIYISMSYCTKNPEFAYILEMISKKILKK